jgi:hypothetical protein
VLACMFWVVVAAGSKACCNVALMLYCPHVPLS